MDTEAAAEEMTDVDSDSVGKAKKKDSPWLNDDGGGKGRGKTMNKSIHGLFWMDIIYTQDES